MHSRTGSPRIRACKALLSLIDYPHLWNGDGPTEEAKKILDQYGGAMSKPQWILYQLVWYVWGRPSDVKVQELMQLPSPLGELAVALLHAMKRGPEAVESWLRRVEGAAKSPETKRWFRQLN